MSLVRAMVVDPRAEVLITADLMMAELSNRESLIVSILMAAGVMVTYKIFTSPIALGPTTTGSMAINLDG